MGFSCQKHESHAPACPLCERDDLKRKLGSLSALLSKAVARVSLGEKLMPCHEAPQDLAFLFHVIDLEIAARVELSKELQDKKLRIKELREAFLAEIKGEPCGEDCAGGHRACRGCDNRAKKAIGVPLRFPEHRPAGSQAKVGDPGCQPGRCLCGGCVM